MRSPRARSESQERLSFDITQARVEARLDSAETCPVTGLTVIEELQEAISDNTSAITLQCGHYMELKDNLEEAISVNRPLLEEAITEGTRALTRVEALENTVAGMSEGTRALTRVEDLERLIVTLPKQLAISRLGGRISDLCERIHSLALTFTDHEELTQARHEELRVELLIRLDPPVL